MVSGLPVVQEWPRIGDRPRQKAKESAHICRKLSQSLRSILDRTLVPSNLLKARFVRFSVEQKSFRVRLQKYKNAEGLSLLRGAMPVILFINSQAFPRPKK